MANTSRPGSGSPFSGRRAAAVTLLFLLVFLALWILAFTLATSFMIALGVGVAVATVSAGSDVVGALVDGFFAVCLAILTPIGAILALIAGLFSV